MQSLLKRPFLHALNLVWLLPAAMALVNFGKHPLANLFVLLVCLAGSMYVSGVATDRAVHALLQRKGDLRDMFGDELVDYLQSCAVTRAEVFHQAEGPQVSSIALQFRDGSSYVTSVPTAQLDAWIPDSLTLDVDAGQVAVGPKYRHRHVARTAHALHSVLSMVEREAQPAAA